VVVAEVLQVIVVMGVAVECQINILLVHHREAEEVAVEVQLVLIKNVQRVAEELVY
jgi:hypothetical protein